MSEPHQTPMFNLIMDHPRDRGNINAFPIESYQIISFSTEAAFDHFLALPGSDQFLEQVRFKPSFPVRRLMALVKMRREMTKLKEVLIEAAVQQDDLEFFQELELYFGECPEMNLLFYLRPKILRYELRKLDSKSDAVLSKFEWRWTNDDAHWATTNWLFVVYGLYSPITSSLAPTSCLSSSDSLGTR